jgi:hypothetical protein
VRQQPRRQPDDRPRQQFERQRNGGDQPRQQSSRVEDAADGWDGPQPQFLRRPQSGQAQPNGGDRQPRDRRAMRERGATRGRDEQSAQGEGSEAQGGPGDSDTAAG